ncbi:MAG TPA: methylated-DNA--[protein]-cysteine S-methyltransferase [Candidatus Saccharimonadales bacterium]|nr:methylated-DNA--[protein]-cysteine S-methyltransferase [Candidatus Saccharimonadales bacterium]
MPVYYTESVVPTGELLLTGDGENITGVYWKAYKKVPEPGADWVRDSSKFESVTRQINEYFAGTRKTFDVKTKRSGTEFQNLVWKVISEIPYNQRLSYKEVAEKVGRPKAVRAVGTAVGSNPLCIIVPCQRVSTTSGGISGYAGGVESKKYLLELEAGN